MWTIIIRINIKLPLKKKLGLLFSTTFNQKKPETLNKVCSIK